jgi:hypothetical protein
VLQVQPLPLCFASRARVEVVKDIEGPKSRMSWNVKKTLPGVDTRRRELDFSSDKVPLQIDSEDGRQSRVPRIRWILWRNTVCKCSKGFQCGVEAPWDREWETRNKGRE